MYIAVTHIGGKYAPGEAISDDMPKEKLDWLIQSGAVRKAAPDPSAPAQKTMTETSELSEEASREMTRQNYAAQLEGMGFTPGGNPIPVKSEADSQADEYETEGEEIDEEAEAPEIDAMAGIVKPAPQEPETLPEKTAKSAEKKSERRKKK